ncbi:MAG: hypothetical protein A2542_00375 [Parcubacteria group bacterium RIFOXYD2_FULL_52_8]|nr:MAG: hypothetical protein A2542_00375 [Parcubacteria group bacterium RIFOXYD2_FULL_52_8]
MGYKVVIPKVTDRLQPVSKEQARELIEHGHLRVPFDMSRVIQPLIKHFFDLTKTDPAYQELWGFDEDGQGESDTGLSGRSGQKKNPRHITPEEIAQGRTHYDEGKWVFHFKPNLEGLLKRRGVELRPQFVELLNYCQAMYTACLLTAYETARALDKLLPGADFYWRLRNNEGHNNLRMLRYKAGVPIKAREHTDKGGFTVHVGSFPPALRIRPGASKRGDEKYPLLNAKEGELHDAIVFFADQAIELANLKLKKENNPKLRTLYQKIKPLYHTVMDRREIPSLEKSKHLLQPGQKEKRKEDMDRWTIVCFIKLAPPRYIPPLTYPKPPKNDQTAARM